MPVDYDRIRAENKQEYGNIARWGKGLLEGQYADRTHFIYEIVQNADDALASQSDGVGNRTLSFSLTENALYITHFGRPFNENDVRGICGIDQSTKELTDIGRFGIGFKSVYAYTSRPEVHSEDEHFAVETYVFPRQIDPRKTTPSQTLIYLPFREDVPAAATEISTALKELDPVTLLFLRHVNEITWEAPDGSSGWIRRSDSALGGLDRRTIQKGSGNSPEIVTQFVVIGRDLVHEGHWAGRTEIAFHQRRDTQGNAAARIRRAQVSKLASFFPTEIDTHLGFLVQGPYRTTPARDNVPFGDEWNRHLVRETAELTVEALEQLRNTSLLDLNALECFLPTSGAGEDSRFAPIHQAVRDALIDRKLIPTDAAHVAGQDAFIGNPPAVIELMGKRRLKQLAVDSGGADWVATGIMSEARRDLLTYLKDEIGVREITPENLIRSMTQKFLEEQPDSWIQKLYRFLSERLHLLARVKRRPIIRLEDGSHRFPFDDDDKPLAFLPGKAATAYPTVKESVAKTKAARAFLKSLGLRQPDIIDDVVDNVLPKYRRPPSSLAVKEYKQDIERIASAFLESNREGRGRLLNAAQGLKLVYATDCGTGERRYAEATEVYQASRRLKKLFEGVSGVLIVDDSKRFLRDEALTELFGALGVPDTLVREQCATELSEQEKRGIRRNTYPYDPQRTLGYEEAVVDFTLRGLDGILRLITSASTTDAETLARLLWDELRRFSAKNPQDSNYSGTYSWFRYTQRRQAFPAAFVKALNQTAWIPGADGELHWPEDVPFSVTGWTDDDRLTEEIEFAPEPTPDPQEEHSTQVSHLRSELLADGFSEQDIEEAIRQSTLDALQQLRDSKLFPTTDKTETHGHGKGEELRETVAERQVSGGLSGSKRSPVTVHIPPNPASSGGNSSENRSMGTINRPHSEPPVRVELNDDDNPEALSHEQRLALEEAAIQKILELESTLERTSQNNAGYDLYNPEEDGKVVEVKSMSGSLEDRPATMTRTQFHTALELSEKYWLYVVEYADDPTRSRIRKIQNPAQRVQTFTFNRSWFESS